VTKRGLRFPLFFPPQLPKHFDEPYPLSATPFVFLSLCVREYVNSHLIDCKHTSPTPPSLPPSFLHTPPQTLQCTQINMSSLLKDRAKIVSLLFLRNYGSGETEIDATQTDGCYSVCLPLAAPNILMCFSWCEETVQKHYTLFRKYRRVKPDEISTGKFYISRS
jgi:hypothetical protein